MDKEIEEDMEKIVDFVLDQERIQAERDFSSWFNLADSYCGAFHIKKLDSTFNPLMIIW